MGQLNNLYVSSSYHGLLKMTNSTTGLTPSLQTIQTGDGQNSPLQMSQTEVNISGSFYINNVPITNGTSGTSGTSGVAGSSGTSGTSGVGGSSGTSGTSGSSGSSGTSGGTGSSGTSGTSGGTGSSGTSGTSGSNGSSGTSGGTGSSGTSGTSGGTGSSGTSGTSGLNGSSGTSGTSGVGGSSGTSGTAGTSGTSGDSIFTAQFRFPSTTYYNTPFEIQVSGSFVASGSNIELTGPTNITGSIVGTGSLREVGDVFIQSAQQTTDFSNITSSYNGNLIFGAVDNLSQVIQTGSYVISGSNNILLKGKPIPISGYYSYISGSGNILNEPIYLSTASLLRPVIDSNILEGGTTQLFYTTSSLLRPQFAANTKLGIGSVTINHQSGSGNFASNLFMGNNIFTSNQNNITSIFNQNITSNIFNGTNTLNHISSSIAFDRNIANGLNGLVVNNHVSSSNAGPQNGIALNRNIFNGNGNFIYASGSNSAQSRTFNDNLIGGNNNIISSSYVGSNNSHLLNSIIYGQSLNVSGSNANTGGGSAFFGRWNATGSLQESSQETVFVVGTGTAANARRNAIRIDSNNNTTVTGSLIITGSLSLNGTSITPSDRNGLITTGSFGTTQSISGSLKITGSIYNRGNGDSINNLAYGEDALFSNQNVMGGGYNNTAIGYNALYYNTTGSTNTAIGANAMLENVSGSNNVGIGDNALRVSKTSNNVAIGSTTLFSQTTGQNNVAIGGNALRDNVSGSNNVGIGSNALSFNAASQNLAIGSNALQNNTIGDSNLAIGYQSLQSNTIGLGNTAIGGNSLVSNVTGSRNVAIGGSSLYYSVKDDNMAIGTNALYNNIGGQYNVAIGTDAQYENIGGSSNIAIGNIANKNRTQGDGNIAIGEKSLWTIDSGSYNIAIGYNAGYNLDNQDKQFFLGHKDFGSLNGDKSGSLMWGVMNDSAVSQSLQINGTLKVHTGSLIVHGHKQFNCGQFTSQVSQSGSANVSQSISFETSGSNYGVTLVSGSRMTVENAGTYNIQFSAQLLADTGADNVYIWFKKNGTNIAGSASELAIGNNEEALMTVNLLDDANANDYYELAWESTQGDAILYYQAASGNRPVVPSVIATLTQVR